MGESNLKQLYLIDGHALIYRAYFALVKNPLTNSKGQPTGAIFGFTNYLLRLIESYQCPYWAVVLDSGKPNFRHTAYPLYKAHRDAMPDDLKSQIPYIKQLIEAFNIPTLCQDGLEADDLIASATKKAVSEGFDVFLVTKDKDLMQLVGPKVKMLAPEGTGVLQTITEKEVIDKMGIQPEKIVDLLALIGDASDNIPGVTGVGPKTAIKILEIAGTVDKVLENPNVLQNAKLIQKITDNIENLRISKVLATLKDNEPLPFAIESLKRQEFSREACLHFFKEMDFHSLLKHPLIGSAKKFTCTTHIVSSTDEIDSIIDKCKEQGSIAISIQSTNEQIRLMELAGISIALNENQSWYFPISHQFGQGLDCEIVLNKLKNLLESHEIKKIGHNLKQTYQVLKNYNIQLNGISFDTLVAAYVNNPGKREYDLSSLCSEYLTIDLLPAPNLTGKQKSQKSIDDIQTPELSLYLSGIACVSILLKNKLEKLLSEQNVLELFNSIEMPLLTVLAELEWYGIQVDKKFLQDLSREYTKQLNGIAQEIYTMAGEEFNINSPKQIGEILFNKLCIPASKKTKSGSHSTNADILESLATDFPIVQKILDYREIQKLLSTYIDTLPLQICPKSGRVHSSFNQTITTTGRLSSTNPNLQNIPIRTDAGRKIRQAFIPDPSNTLIAADYSQIELRLLAHLSKDPFLLNAFQEDQDIHTQTAAVIFNVHPEFVTASMRRSAKTINFGLMYGMGPINLSRQLKISYNEAKNFIENYFNQFPKIREYMEGSIQKAKDCGYSETLLGRKRFLPELQANNKILREAAERTAINTPVQGTAADIIKLAMIKIHDSIRKTFPNAKMLLQVHDELVFEIPSNESVDFRDWVIDQMSSAYSLSVPLKVDANMGSNWSDAH